MRSRRAYRHAPGFGVYLRASGEKPHPVPAVNVMSARVYRGSVECARCTYPVVHLNRYVVNDAGIEVLA